MRNLAKVDFLFMEIKQSRFIQAMDQLQAQAAGQSSLPLSKVVQILGEEGHGVILLFLSIPYLQPMPLMGLSTPFGLLIILIGWFLYRHTPPWVPARFAQLPVSAQLIIKVSEGAEKVWGKLAFVFKNRYEFVFTGPLFPLVNLLVLGLNGLLLALPLPVPFSNTVPTWPILFMALGLMERDGLFVLLSYFLSLVSIAFFLGLGLATYYGISLL